MTPAVPLRADQDSSNRRLEPARLGILLFIVMEAMLFAGFISAFLVFRLSPVQWPPAGQPRLSVAMASVSTVLLLLSGFSFQAAFQALKAGRMSSFLRFLNLTALQGVLFLATQGLEWVRLVHFGLNIHTNVFGGFFYVLVGFHGLHVAGGLTALLWVLSRAHRNLYGPSNSLGVEVCRTYWFFVVGLWPIIFGLIYF
jgi:cytochrome c oxidase subunit III